MAVAAPKVKCCSKRATKLKQASYAKAKAAADAGQKIPPGKKAPARKARARKASARSVQGCSVCGKK